MERAKMPDVAVNIDRLAQFYLADAFFEMPEDAEQFLRRGEGAVAAPGDPEGRRDEFLEFRAQQGKFSACVGDVDRRHAIEQRPWEQNVRGAAVAAAHGVKQCRIQPYGSFRSVVQRIAPCQPVYALCPLRFSRYPQNVRCR